MFLPIALDAYRAGQIKNHIHIERCLAKAMFNVDVASFTGVLCLILFLQLERVFYAFNLAAEQFVYL